MHTKPRLHWRSCQDVEKAALFLQKGEVVVGSSDTVLGLFATVSQQGYRALNALKHRSDKPYLILIDRNTRVAEYTSLPLPAWVTLLMDHFWPGPLTLVVKARQELASWAQASDGTIALRVPDHEGIRQLVERVGPLFSTSANLAGEPIPADMNDIAATIIQKVAACIEDDHLPSAAPSTIVDCTGDDPVVVREGIIPSAEIMATCLG